MTIANTSTRFTLNDINGNRSIFVVLAHVGGGEVTITEITEREWRTPRVVERFVSVSEFLVEAERNGVADYEVRARIVAKAQPKKRGGGQRD